MHSELARKSNDDAATEVLQTWLLGAHQQLVCNFLESLGVEHDGRGLLDSSSEPNRLEIASWRPSSRCSRINPASP